MLASVCLTVRAGSVFVPNYSFEAPIASSAGLNTNVFGWSYSGVGTNVLVRAGYDPQLDGVQYLSIRFTNGTPGSVTGGIDSTALTKIASNFKYVLTAAVRLSGQGQATIQLLAGTNEVSSTLITSNSNSFYDYVTSFQTLAEGELLVDLPLTIRLKASGVALAESLIADFDNIRLTASLLRPPVAARRSGAGQLRLSWPIYYTNFFVESISNLSSISWLPVTTGINAEGTEWAQYVSNPAHDAFFRLRGPEPLPSDHVLNTPILGLNTYYNVGINVSEALVKMWIDRSYEYGLVDLGWKYIIIDDGWQGGRTNGILYPDGNKFPNITNLVQYAHDRGLRIGLYTEPSDITSDGLPGSKGYLEQDAATFASWGIDYVKFDVISPQDNQLKLDQAIEFTTAFRAAAFPRPVVVMSSGYRDFVTNFNPLAMSAALDMWRPVGDLGSFIPSGYNNLWTNYVDVWLGNAERYDYAVGPGHWIDLDHVVLDETNTTRGTFAMSAMLCVPAITAYWATPSESPFRYQMMTNRALIRIHQDSLGKPARRVLSNDFSSVWIKNLDNGDRAVALLNHKTNVAVSVRFDWTNAGFSSNQQLSVFDCWKYAVVTNAFGSFSGDVPGMSAGLFILSPVQVP